jgi:predicted DNA-binding protein
MRAGRYTDDKKDSTVKLRLSGDMREQLEDKARHGSVSISEYIRNLIAEDLQEG